MLRMTSPLATDVVSRRADPPVIAYAIPETNRIAKVLVLTSSVEFGAIGIFRTGVLVPIVGATARLNIFRYLNDDDVFAATSVNIIPFPFFTLVAFVEAAEIKV
jgi:hypothetical protein